MNLPGPAGAGGSVEPINLEVVSDCWRELEVLVKGERSVMLTSGGKMLVENIEKGCSVVDGILDLEEIGATTLTSSARWLVSEGEGLGVGGSGVLLRRVSERLLRAAAHDLKMRTRDCSNELTQANTISQPEGELKVRGS